MIEFQLTIYMCSHCTRVHNDSQDCVRHEIDEHAANSTKITESIENHQSPDESMPFAIADDNVDVKPTKIIEEPQEEMTDLQMQTSATDKANSLVSNISEEVRSTRQLGTKNLNEVGEELSILIYFHFSD